MIFLYEKKFEAFRSAYANSLPIVSLFGSRHYGDRDVIECRAKVLIPEQRAALESAGIGVDDTMEELPEALKIRVEAFLCDPFFTTHHITSQVEYDFRKSGKVLFLCDRENKIVVICKSGDEYSEPYYYRYNLAEVLKELILSDPIQKIVLFRDFWGRVPPFNPSTVAEDYPILRKTPKEYPEPIKDEPKPTEAPSAPSPASDLLPFAIGTVMRLELVDEVRTVHFWDGAVYINKEQLKRWGARFHGVDKYWYLETVPTAEVQRAIKAMHIIIRPRYT